MPDTAWLWAALAAYATAAALAVRALVPVSSGPSWPIPAGFNAGQAASAGRHAGMARASPHRYIFGLLMVAVLLHTFALAVRWRALDHGPFTTIGHERAHNPYLEEG